MQKNTKIPKRQSIPGFIFDIICLAVSSTTSAAVCIPSSSSA
jgi:hypothetical protein